MEISLKGIASVLLGVWLMASPWVLGFAAVEPAGMWTALLAGIALTAFGMMQFDSHDGLLYWMLMATGAAIAVSPFVLGFSDHPGALASKLATAGAVLAVSVAAILAARRSRQAGGTATA